MPNLREVLFSREAQREIIAKGAEALHTLNEHSHPGKLYGQEDPAEDAANGNVSINASALLRTLNSSHTCDTGDRVAGYFQQLANVEESSVVLAYAALAILALFPTACEEVMASTPSNLYPYLFGNHKTKSISERFELYITGGDGTPAKLPLEMVAAEYILFHRLSH